MRDPYHRMKEAPNKQVELFILLFCKNDAGTGTNRCIYGYKGS